MRHRTLFALGLLYFGPFLFLGPLLCSGDAALGEEPLASSAVLVGPEEPGEPLEVRGTVVAPDGETPVPGVELYVYHTDRDGYYSGQTTSSANPRIKATLRTDSEGRYSFATIRPGAYPASGVPQHIHFVVRLDDGIEERHDMHFEGDPLLSERMIERSRQAGRFGSVRPVERDDEGIWQAVFDLRLGG